MSKLVQILRPVLEWLFPDSKNNEEAMENISINTISNLFGLGMHLLQQDLKQWKAYKRKIKIRID